VAKKEEYTRSGAEFAERSRGEKKVLSLDGERAALYGLLKKISYRRSMSEGSMDEQTSLLAS